MMMMMRRTTDGAVNRVVTDKVRVSLAALGTNRHKHTHNGERRGTSAWPVSFSLSA